MRWDCSARHHRPASTAGTWARPRPCAIRRALSAGSATTTHSRTHIAHTMGGTSGEHGQNRSTFLAGVSTARTSRHPRLPVGENGGPGSGSPRTAADGSVVGAAPSSSEENAAARSRSVARTVIPAHAGISPHSNCGDQTPVIPRNVATQHTRPPGAGRDPPPHTRHPGARRDLAILEPWRTDTRHSSRTWRPNTPVIPAHAGIPTVE